MAFKILDKYTYLLVSNKIFFVLAGTVVNVFSHQAYVKQASLKKIIFVGY
jgi:hypothetical protein